MTDDPPCLHVCTTCRAGEKPAPGEPPPGRRLLDALAHALAARDGAAPVRLRAVQCLALCGEGCTVAISSPGKWGYLLGRLSEAAADDLLVYAGAYAAARTGTVMPSRRPASLAAAVLARFPTQGAEALS